MNYLGVFGHVNVDYVVRVPKFPEKNASIATESKNKFFGGTGANLAVMASKLGVKTSLASFVGDDFPKDFYETLRKGRIDLKDLRVVKGYSTPTCYVFTDGKNQLNFIHQGPMKDSHKFTLLSHTIRSSELIHIGTGNPKYYSKVAAFSKKLKKDIAFDPGQEIHYVYNPKSFQNMLKATKYFFCNEIELKTARKFLKIKRAEGMLDYVDVLILTRGEKGSRIYTRDGKYSIPAIRPRKFVDATGAGDAYRAGFYAALSRDYGLKICGYAGAIASKLVIETLGAQTKLPRWDEIKRGLKRHIQHFKD